MVGREGWNHRHQDCQPAFFIGRPQHTFWTGAVLPHFAHRKKATGYSLSMMVAMPWPNPMHMVWSP